MPQAYDVYRPRPRRSVGARDAFTTPAACRAGGKFKKKMAPPPGERQGLYEASGAGGLRGACFVRHECGQPGFRLQAGSRTCEPCALPAFCRSLRNPLNCLVEHETTMQKSRVRHVGSRPVWARDILQIGFVELTLRFASELYPCFRPSERPEQATFDAEVYRALRISRAAGAGGRRRAPLTVPKPVDAAYAAAVLERRVISRRMSSR